MTRDPDTIIARLIRHIGTELIGLPPHAEADLIESLIIDLETRVDELRENDDCEDDDDD